MAASLPAGIQLGAIWHAFPASEAVTADGLPSHSISQEHLSTKRLCKSFRLAHSNEAGVWWQPHVSSSEHSSPAGRPPGVAPAVAPEPAQGLGRGAAFGAVLAGVAWP